MAGQRGTVLAGRELAQIWRAEVSREAHRLRQTSGHTPTLAVLQVGERPDSEVYVRRKREACDEAGMHCSVLNMSGQSTEAEVVQRVHSLCADISTDGVLVQLPLPSHIRQGAIASAIDPGKDVDGLHPYSVGSLALRNVEPMFAPATARGVMELMRRHQLSAYNARCLVLGNSNSVGLPLGFMLRDAGARSVCTLPPEHAVSDEGKRLGRAADLIFAAIGSPHSIGTEHASAGASIVDVGINAFPIVPSEAQQSTSDANGECSDQRYDEQTPQPSDASEHLECQNGKGMCQWSLSSDGRFKVAGDVCMEPLIEQGCNVSPVPGGAGPMTVSALLHNLLNAAEERVCNNRAPSRSTIT